MLAISAAALLAACSSDIERLGDYPPIDNTASVAPDKVEAKPVAPVANSSSPWNTPTPSWASNRGGYAAPVRRTARTWQSPAAAPAPAHAASGSLVVRPGQTLFSIARANGKTVAELMAANGLSSPEIKVGQRIVIPGVANPVSPAPTVHRAAHVATQSATPRPAAASARPAMNTASTRRHRVQPGETWYALGRKYGVHPRKIAAYNGLSLSQGLKVGQVVKIPASQGWSMASRPANSSRAERPGRSKATSTVTRRHVAKVAKDESRLTPTRQTPQRLAGNQQEQRLSASQFILPVSGRIIGAFGKGQNFRKDGIDIAAPEGAPIRAAADGVVAYAGNELKEFGNLVLIRHKGGWVTAYAHAKELKVNKGDKVKKGQVIATVGKTGDVKSAQLHFQLRKGAMPVNPLQYLGTPTAMR